MKKTYLIFTLLFFFVIVTSDAGNAVRVVYFVPADRTPNWSIPVALDATIKAVQRFYTEQMRSYGYNKSFAIEKDKDSNVVVHYIAGKDNDTSYNYLKIEAEVKSRFDVTKDIFIVVADLSRGRIDDNCGFADFNGRMIIVPAGGDCVEGDNGITLIAHELGHSFNLEHDFSDETDIMSYGAGRNRLSKCAAYALNVNPFFNNRNYTGATANTNINMLTTNVYPKGHDNWKLRFSVTDLDGIHQIQFAISNPVERASILECKDFDNTRNATVDFRMPKSYTILPSNYAHIRVIDKKGFLSTKQYPLIIENTQENKSTNSNTHFTHLTLTHDHTSSLVPTNSPWEWGKHVKFWEQTPDRKLDVKPHGAVPIETHIPYYDQWDYFFYSHAPSDIVYDLGEGNYEKFESNFFLPNPCSNVASVELTFLADGIETYKSDVMRGSNSQNIKISFDIPRGTKEFTIKVTEAGDGPGCDHFIFANARLVHGKPPPRKVDPKIAGPKLSLSFSTTTTNVRVGDTFTLHLNSEKVTDLAGWQFGIVFDPAVLEALEVSEGDFLKRQDGTTFFRQGRIDNAAGKIIGLSSALISEKGVSGTGTLLSVTFSAKAAGETQVTLRDFEFGSINGKVIPIVPYEIVINVGDQPAWDVNQDGRISILDLILVARRLGETASANAEVDVNGDGVISILDLIVIAQHMGESTAAAPSTIAINSIKGLNPAMLQTWIERAHIEDDGSIAFQQGIASLQRLLKSLVPEKTTLLTNYPNPFNPETWIPYQLAAPADVSISIYAANGVLVRTLALGHQPAGIYHSRNRAIHWDGKNALGERVASGVYFYTLTAGEFVATRRMVILK